SWTAMRTSTVEELQQDAALEHEILVRLSLATSRPAGQRTVAALAPLLQNCRDLQDEGKELTAIVAHITSLIAIHRDVGALREMATDATAPRVTQAALAEVLANLNLVRIEPG